MKTGTSTGGIWTSKRYDKKRARKRKAEELDWQTRVVEPVIMRIGDYEIYVKSQARQDIAAARERLLAAIAAGEPPGVVRPAP
jgi:hypothetical protein